MARVRHAYNMRGLPGLQAEFSKALDTEDTDMFIRVLGYACTLIGGMGGHMSLGALPWGFRMCESAWAVSRCVCFVTTSEP